MPQLSHLQRQLLWTDVPDTFVMLLPVVAQRDEPSPSEIFVREASADWAHCAERPPSSPARMDIHARRLARHSESYQAVHDVPLALPALQDDGAQTATEMAIDSVEGSAVFVQTAKYPTPLPSLPETTPPSLVRTAESQR